MDTLARACRDEPVQVYIARPVVRWSGAMRRDVRVAVVQAAPVQLDRAASLERALGWISRAAECGAELVVLGETWLSGYPAWLDCCPGVALWGDPAVKRVYAAMRASAVAVPGPEVERLAAAAREHGVVIGLGVQERVERGGGTGTLYNTALIFDGDGALRVHHRKLMPTYSERLVWGQGDCEGLGTVETAVGRVGVLICWEHWMPLARQALHADGEAIHLALWPSVSELHALASRHYAIEGRCFVLAAGSILREAELPRELGPPRRGPHAHGDLVLRGGSCIFGPDGSCVAGPLHDVEDLLVADLALGRIDEEVMTLDVAGHYHRPDVLELRRLGGRTRVRERGS